MENETNPTLPRFRLRLDQVFALFLIVPLALLLLASVLRSDYLGKLGAISAAPLAFLMLGAFVANFLSRSSPEQRKAKLAKAIRTLLPEIKANPELKLQAVIDHNKLLTVTSTDGKLFLDGTERSEEEIIESLKACTELCTKV